MREILFRGKRVRDGEWVYGSLILAGSYCCILESYEKVHPMDYPYLDDDLGTIDGKATPVDPETVGEYTGLTDKDGKKIFEGDIIQTRRFETYQEELKGYCGYDSEGYPKRVPGYTGSMFITKQRTIYDHHAVVLRDRRGRYYLSGTSMFIDAICNEVIGNIYDNPELVEVEQYVETF